MRMGSGDGVICPKNVDKLIPMLNILINACLLKNTY